MQGLDYDKYSFSVPEYLKVFAETAGLLCLIGYLFFDSWWLLILIIPSYMLFVRFEKKQKIEKRKKQLGNQFKDAIILVYSFVASGSPLELAMERASKDLLLTYKENDDIVREFKEIVRKLSMNVSVENCLEDFAKRSCQTDIADFAQVIAIAKRSGGSMTVIIKNSVDAIRSKVEVENEITVIVAGKRREFQLMVLIPAAIILYMRLFSAGFMDVLYGNPAGQMVMGICLLVYIVAICWGRKILCIQV